MKKSDVVKMILAERADIFPLHKYAKAYAPSNIALCKYWGKRDVELNLPVTSSFSVSLKDKGSTTELFLHDAAEDSAEVNGQLLDWQSPFGKRLTEFLALFRPRQKLNFKIKITANIPIGAGLASSACGYASVLQALNLFFGWELSAREQSILARLGSGSASRSIWQGFVEWHAGERHDGMDSYAEPAVEVWPDLCIGLLVLNAEKKAISSRAAMQRTVTTSPLYAAWPATVDRDLAAIKQAIQKKEFELLGKTAEANALAMHATMLSAWPPVLYSLPETINVMQKIWQLREAGLKIFFTQDAGPNLKLIFLRSNLQLVRENFPDVDVVFPF